MREKIRYKSNEWTGTTPGEGPSTGQEEMWGKRTDGKQNCRVFLHRGVEGAMSETEHRTGKSIGDDGSNVVRRRKKKEVTIRRRKQKPNKRDGQRTDSGRRQLDSSKLRGRGWPGYKEDQEAQGKKRVNGDVFRENPY